MDGLVFNFSKKPNSSKICFCQGCKFVGEGCLRIPQKLIPTKTITNSNYSTLVQVERLCRRISSFILIDWKYIANTCTLYHGKCHVICTCVINQFYDSWCMCTVCINCFYVYILDWLFCFGKLVLFIKHAFFALNCRGLWSLDLCSCLLPQVQDLMDSKYDRYINV